MRWSVSFWLPVVLPHLSPPECSLIGRISSYRRNGSVLEYSLSPSVAHAKFDVTLILSYTVPSLCQCQCGKCSKDKWYSITFCFRSPQLFNDNPLSFSNFLLPYSLPPSPSILVVYLFHLSGLPPPSSSSSCCEPPIHPYPFTSSSGKKS